MSDFRDWPGVVLVSWSEMDNGRGVGILFERGFLWGFKAVCLGLVKGGGSHRDKNRVRYFEAARAVARCSVR